MKKLLLIISLFFFCIGLRAQLCVGAEGQVRWESWHDLPSGVLGELRAYEFYPNSPSVSQIIYKLQSPINYNNSMGGRISGFIKVENSDQVLFNLTGDNESSFYLSTDISAANLELIAYADNSTGITEHERYPSQTSSLQSLTGGSYYYFVLEYADEGGSDHASVYWKTINDDPDEWKLINSSFIYEVACLPAECPERGTPCDDGVPQTIEDQEDGHCNCLGLFVDDNDCVGDHAEITSYTYKNIPGGSLNDLYSDQNFPGMPSYSREHAYLGMPRESERDSFGTLIQGFLTVPVTGNYKFNVTGNSETIFFLSSDHTIENKQAHQILVSGPTATIEHDKFIYQSTGNILMEKGQFYYYELNHKESSGSEHFGAFWQTPFTTVGDWKRISDFYVYDYECEIACVPQGTTCDDGNPYTNNDAYDENCECVGMPCAGSDCDDPLVNYIPYASCDLTDQIDNNANNNWLSCSLDVNPNSLRANSHWIKYDFGMTYQLHASQVWNYNVGGSSQLGFETVAIDYSVDGINWIELGVFNWALSDGTSGYSGFVGPSFNANSARYVLITSLDNPNDEQCRGFGKITINASSCPQYQQVCDDGNQFTIDDKINWQCECEGIYSVENDCDIDHLTLGNILLENDKYSAIQSVTSENLLDDMGETFFIAGDHINLLEGFEVPIGVKFTAQIDPCESDDNQSLRTLGDESFSALENKVDILKVISIPDTDEQIIQWHVQNPGRQKLSIINSNGLDSYSIIDAEFLNIGIYQKRIRTHKLPAGVFQVLLDQDGAQVLEKMVVI